MFYSIFLSLLKYFYLPVCIYYEVPFNFGATNKNKKSKLRSQIY